MLLGIVGARSGMRLEAGGSSGGRNRSQIHGVGVIEAGAGASTLALHKSSQLDQALGRDDDH